MSTSNTMPSAFSIAKTHEAQKRLCNKIMQEDMLPKKIPKREALSTSNGKCESRT